MFTETIYQKHNKMISKIISGGQLGADQGGLQAAKGLGIATGGFIPKNYRTELGNQPELKELYGLEETESSEYPPRTAMNIKSSDGTIRIATNFNSAGEKLTLKLIKQYNKPYFDINPLFPCDVKEVQKWIRDNRISVLNIAGNRESASSGIEEFTKKFLTECLKEQI